MSIAYYPLVERTCRVVVTAAIVLTAVPARAERLPLAHYTTAHGLPSNELSVVIEDGRGFLWIGSYRGLSRFDGRGFRNFGKEHGLDKSTNVTSLALAPDASLWVGVWGGIYRFDLTTGSFTEMVAEGRHRVWERVVVAVDREGTLWCGTIDGLYRSEQSHDAKMLHRVSLPAHVELPAVSALLVDRAGNLWVASNDLYRRGVDGRWTRIEAAAAARPGLEAISLVEDPTTDGLFITTVRGVWRVNRCLGDGSTPCRIERATNLELQPGRAVASESGGLWVATTKGLVELDAHGRLVRTLTRSDGLATSNISPAVRDATGNLWLVADGNGLQRLASEGFTSYGASEGLMNSSVASILTTRSGDLVVAGPRHVLHRYQNGQFVASYPKLPAGIRRPGWGWYQFDMQDRRGDWWVPTDDGLLHYEHVRQLEDLAGATPVVLREGCFAGNNVFRLYEDVQENIWIGTTEQAGSTLYRWNRSSGRFDCYSSETIVGSHVAPTAFLEIGDALWIGFGEGQVARYHDNRFECLFNCATTDHGNVNALLCDSHGRVWIATHRSGLLRVDDPGTLHPGAVRITTKDGLSSEQTYALVEDRFGRIYVGTERGVDVLDGYGRVMHHYGTDDGLPSPIVSIAYADSHQDLWFGTTNGVARFTPIQHPLRAADSARVLVDAIRVSGVSRRVSAVGEERVSGVVLESDQRNLEIDFIGLPRQAAATFKFQYRLSETEPWSPPSPNRSIVLAGLSSGSHRLEIRASDVSGNSSPHIATIDIDVRAPFYWRPWFLATAALMIVMLGAAAYQARVAHLTALERQRTQIAMDLHDQMGSQLGSIGLLADLGAGDAVDASKRRQLFDQIAQTTAQMGSALSDIVWSMRHRRMTIEDLGVHLREHGHRLFPSPPPELEISYPEDWPRIELTPAAGRGVLLIALEALHNAARHADAAHLQLVLRSRGRRWQLVVADDGRGLLPRDPDHDGFGLETMRRRAHDLGAVLDITSPPGHGTTVALTFDPRAEDRSLRNRTNFRRRGPGPWSTSMTS